MVACNNDGVWNETGATASFTIAPAYFQTTWFEFGCAAILAGSLWLLYLWRLRQATAQIQERLGAQLEERERIARELHDTLLQGVQGLVLRFHAVMKTLPAPEQTRQMLEKVLDRADEIMLEGRQRVRDLREQGTAGQELSKALEDCGEELAEHSAAMFNLLVVGTPRALGPVVFNETYRIAREGMINAFQHAQATKIEIELTYSDAALSIRVGDDGTGIDPQILSGGKARHWGISGMRERAQKMGGRLNTRSSLGAGTEMDLTIPAKLAYPVNPPESLCRRLIRLTRGSPKA